MQNVRCKDAKLGRQLAPHLQSHVLGPAIRQVHLWMWVMGDKGGDMARG